jgi:hypothetical protein
MGSRLSGARPVVCGCQRRLAGDMDHCPARTDHDAVLARRNRRARSSRPARTTRSGGAAPPPSGELLRGSLSRLSVATYISLHHSRVRKSRPVALRGREPRDDRVATILARIHAAVGCPPSMRLRRSRRAAAEADRRARPGFASVRDLHAGVCTKARRRAGGEPGRRVGYQRPEWRSSPEYEAIAPASQAGWRGEPGDPNRL